MLSTAPAMGAEKHPDHGKRPKFVGFCNTTGDSLRKWIVGMFPGFKGDLAQAEKTRNEICAPWIKLNKQFRPKPKGFCNVAGEELERFFFIMFPDFKGYPVQVDKIQKAICASMIKFKERLRKKE